MKYNTTGNNLTQQSTKW